MGVLFFGRRQTAPFFVYVYDTPLRLGQQCIRHERIGSFGVLFMFPLCYDWSDLGAKDLEIHLGIIMDLPSTRGGDFQQAKALSRYGIGRTTKEGFAFTWFRAGATSCHAMSYTDSY